MLIFVLSLLLNISIAAELPGVRGDFANYTSYSREQLNFTLTGISKYFDYQNDTDVIIDSKSIGISWQNQNTFVTEKVSLKEKRDSESLVYIEASIKNPQTGNRVIGLGTADKNGLNHVVAAEFPAKAIGFLNAQGEALTEIPNGFLVILEVWDNAKFAFQFIGRTDSLGKITLLGRERDQLFLFGNLFELGPQAKVILKVIEQRSKDKGGDLVRLQLEQSSEIGPKFLDFLPHEIKLAR